MPSNVSRKKIARCKAPVLVMAAEKDCLFSGAGVIRQRIKAKVHSPLYTFIDALGASKPPACFIFDENDRDVAERKNQEVAQYVQGFMGQNVAYTYYYDETTKCGRFILIDSFDFVMGAIERLEGETE